jgi:deoxyhypusine synthase
MKEERHEYTQGKGFEDGFEPVVSLDLDKVNSFSDLTKAMSNTSFQGRNLGEAADVLHEMVADKDCFVVLTLAGAMTVGKMGLMIADMIDKGFVHAIVSTGALMAHGFIEAAGYTHFKYHQEMDDKKLYKKGYDRVYDTLELEQNLDDSELIVREVFRSIDHLKPTCSYKLNWELGKYLKEKVKGRGILKSAYEKKIPVYIPAFTDSEFGLDFALHNIRMKMQKKPFLEFNPFMDLEHYTGTIKKQKTIGIFTIGGGVPRNWAQQVGPYLDLIRWRLEEGAEYFDAKSLKRFKYGVRICPEPVHWGGLSGCTYSEGVSWGKFVPKSEGGKWAEVLSDATVAWPIILKSVMERIKEVNKNLPYFSEEKSIYHD